MINVLKLGLRASIMCLNKPSPLSLQSIARNFKLTPTYSRTFWHMCSTSKSNQEFLKPKPLTERCECGCSGLLHTSGEKDLVEFLRQEIAEEKKNQKVNGLPAELDGFAISGDQAELFFKKKTQLETITVSMNVNHSVDSDGIGPDGNFSETMKARPSFEVDIVKNNKTLSFTCSFTQLDETGEPDMEDKFEINEVTFFEGEWQEKTYAISAELLDENLYDLFMNVLEEKGITKHFVEAVSEIATSYEHSQYIGLLENVRKFASVN